MSDGEASNPGNSQRVSGAANRRETINFVPAALTLTQATQVAPRTTPSISPRHRYLNIVLKNGAATEDHDSASTEVLHLEKSATQQQFELKGIICEVCSLPIDASGDVSLSASMSHESTIAHMVCLTHSHPPSPLDRSRLGLKYLSSYGWDPDSRQGLGAKGEGIKAPIKAKVKNDTVGIGVKTKGIKNYQDPKVERMNAKQVWKKDMEDRRKRERLQEMFYRNNDLEKYLGGG